jgi:hypothetical protein
VHSESTSQAPQPYTITISFEDGTIKEGLLVTPMGQNIYRLENSAIFGEPKFHDIVETEPHDDGTQRFVCIRQRAKLIHGCWCLTKELIESPEMDVFLAKVVSAGGCWEIHFGGVLLLHLPPKERASLMREFKQMFRS